MEDYSFTVDTRVRFAETDAQGVAHNSSYLVWFEVARVEYLREYAGGYQKIRDTGLESLVLETHIRYLEPARFDDVIHIHARCLDLRGARFRFEYSIERDGTPIADGWTSHAMVDHQTLRPTRVPEWLADAIATAESAASSAASPSASSASAAGRARSAS
jgi:acyl-CoA thioester hydrolase